VGALVHVKVCGVTTVADAVACVELGASAVGVNFVSSSPRCVTVERGREIARAVKGRTLMVGVVADLGVGEMRRILRDAEIECLQLHGDETVAVLTAMLPHAYKAARVGSKLDVERARAFPGRYLLVDARVEGTIGGTGKTFDWSLVTSLAKERQLTLAGGLTPENVGDAVRAVRPYCVDVASGVESAPGTKDLEKVRTFVAATRDATAE
jgi:phosphoribosylanthranilate isomerase